MKIINKSLLPFLLIFMTLQAQKVETLISGPSTFNDGLAIDKEGNIYASRYYSSTVTKINLNGTTEIFADGFKDPNGIAVGPDEYLYVTNATGNRVDKVSPSGTKTTVISNLKNPTGIAFDKSGNMIIASYEQSKLFLKDNNGNISDFLDGGGLNGPVGLVFDKNDNLYIGNFNDGKILKRTPDGNVTIIGDIPGWLGFIAYSNGYIYATAYQFHKIYRIKDDGTEQIVYAGTGSTGSTGGELLESTFNGPNGIVASATGDTLFISDFGTRSLRMITGVKGDMTNIEKIANIPNKLELQQNYPNPFNPSTKIEYSLLLKGHVELKVYNILGTEVTTLVDGEQSRGRYKVTFDASNLSSGVYFYRLQAGNNSEVKKMHILK